MKAELYFLSALCLSFLTNCNQVSIEEGVLDEGQECFKIITPSATYLYQKEAGGFSSILDQEGNDWVSFHPDTAESYPRSASTSYRGLPNLVFRSEDGGAGHPGFRKCFSEKISDNRIRTRSKSGNWEWIWSFFQDHAELEMIRTDPEHTYWFLYEGTVHGKYRPHIQYWGTDKGGPDRTLPDYYYENAEYDTWKWIYFGEENTERIFYIVHTEPDTLMDTFSYLGNSDQGIIAPDGMVVFGFGRARNAKPLLTSEKNRFIIGFIEQEVENPSDHKKISDRLSEYINN